METENWEPLLVSLTNTEVDEVKIRYHFHVYTVMYNLRNSMKVGLFKMYQMQNAKKCHNCYVIEGEMEKPSKVLNIIISLAPTCSVHMVTALFVV